MSIFANDLSLYDLTNIYCYNCPLLYYLFSSPLLIQPRQPMIKHYVQFRQNKCNFCYNWFTPTSNIKNCLHICEACLNQALQSTSFKVLSPINSDLYQILLVKNTGNLYSGINAQNFFNSIDEAVDEIKEAQSKKDYLLDMVDEYRNKEMQLVQDKWNKIINSIHKKQKEIDTALQKQYEDMYRSILESTKVQNQGIGSILEGQDITMESQYKPLLDVGLQTQKSNKKPHDLSFNSKIINQKIKSIKYEPPQEVRNEKYLKYQKIINQAKKFINNKQYNEEKTAISENIKNHRYSLGNQPLRKKFPILKKTSKPDQSDKQSEDYSIRVLEEKDMNLPNTRNITHNNNKVLTSFKSISEAQTPNKSLKTCKSTLTFKKSPHNKMLTRCDQSFIQKQLQSLKNNKLKSDIYQYLLNHYPKMIPSTLLLTTLDIYDTVINTNTLNKCIELISYNIQNLGPYIRCYLEVLEWVGVQVLKIVKGSLTDRQFQIILEFIGDKKLKIETLVVTANALTESSYNKLLELHNNDELEYMKSVYMSRNRIKLNRLRFGPKQSQGKKKKMQVFV